HGSLREWLRQITVNRVRAHWKSRQQRPRTGLGAEGEQFLAQLDDPESELSRQWDRDHDKHVFQKLLALVQADFAPATWQAFTRYFLDGLSAAQVGRELGMSENAVMQAKFRVLKRLRQEAGEFVE